MRNVHARLVWAAATIALAVAGSICIADAAELRVATFRCDVTPPLGQAIYATYKPLEVIEFPLLAKGIVLDDGGQRYVLCAIDWCELQDSSHLMFRQKMAEAAGADPTHVAVHTVHQHTAPMVNLGVSRLLAHVENPPPYPDEKYFEKVADQVAAAVKDSLARLQPFDRIGTGEGPVERVASNRRIIDANGKVRTRWSVVTGKDLPLRDEPEGLIDPMLKTITLAQGDKPLVRLHFYACHPQSFYHDPRASYDFPGMAREALEKKEGVFQVYFTGCSGDVLVGKYNDGTPAAREQFAQRLTAGMEASIAATRLVAAGPIQWRTIDLTLPLYAPPGRTMAENRARINDPTQEAGPRIDAAMRISFAERLARPLALASLQIGRVHIVDLPGECFVAYQLFAQHSATGDFVAVAAYSDTGTGYICTDKALEQGGYEPDSSNVGPSTEALLKDAIVQLLGVKP
jgi:hypothetical protein